VILLLNAQSIVGKIDELCCVATELALDLIIVTESLCNDTMTNAYLTVPGFELQPELRKDRVDTTYGIGGGPLVYV
jgi:hypothetical protein